MAGKALGFRGLGEMGWGWVVSGSGVGEGGLV